MEITGEQFYDFLEDEVLIIESVEAWKRGTREVFVLPLDGKYYRFNTKCTEDDGYDIARHQVISLQEVEPREVPVIKYFAIGE